MKAAGSSETLVPEAYTSINGLLTSLCQFKNSSWLPWRFFF